MSPNLVDLVCTRVYLAALYNLTVSTQRTFVTHVFLDTGVRCSYSRVLKTGGDAETDIANCAADQHFVKEGSMVIYVPRHACRLEGY